ncbi:MAG: phosphoesterase [Deltaproteobacteria bacterium]|nr:MAG: phosphoesterase [Deltaproteobacteria bacterium]
MKPITFGTEGWRGEVARDFTFEGVRRVTAALADFLNEEGSAQKGVAISFDRRFLAEEFAKESARVLAARGIKVHLSRSYLPTPVLSWSVREYGLASGVMITASHNPPEWNGFKIKGPHGGPEYPERVKAIEELLNERYQEGASIPVIGFEEARESGLILDLNPRKEYLEWVSGLIDFEMIRQSAPRIAVDSMHGCSAGWTADILRSWGCTVSEINASSDPLFGGTPPEPKSGNLTELMALVKESDFILGIASDGDGDRLAAVDEKGNFFSPQRIMALFAKYLKEERGMDGGVVKAVSATVLLDLLAKAGGYKVITTPIGFKNMSPHMTPGAGIFMAGEESGAIGVTEHLPERDGIFNALLLTEIVSKYGMGPRGAIESIFKELGHFTFDRLDTRFDRSLMESISERVKNLPSPVELCGLPVTRVERMDGVKIFRDDNSWLMVRVSGTEPLLRLYAEGRSEEDVERLLQEGKKLAGI